MKGKVVIITGASSGIGRALAIEFSKKGSKVALAARNSEKLDAVLSEVKQYNADAISVVTDVSVVSDCENLVKKTVEAFGKIDVSINNAGISMRSMFIDTDLSVMHKVIDTNYWGTVNCTKFALPYLVEQKGSLVGVISIAGYLGLPARSAYSSSKYAIRGFLDTIRVEYLKSGLHVLVAAPGFTASNIRKVALLGDGSPQGETPRNEEKMMTSEQVAKKIYRAVVKRKRTLILTFVEGKFAVFLSKWFPSLLDRFNYNHMAKEEGSPLG